MVEPYRGPRDGIGERRLTQASSAASLQSRCEFATCMEPRCKISRLGCLGFKSFVEPTELVIEPGLTGVVGPERLRQIQPARSAALGHGRDLAQEHARGRHGRRDLLRHQRTARRATRRK